jgi:hypothetical protein
MANIEVTNLKNSHKTLLLRSIAIRLLRISRRRWEKKNKVDSRKILQ